ncbi:MAG: rhodanese-like domain-containing protein [Nitrospiraceae bacterium]|nr:MAG: rhodanese-like domain-containing protein [Nitrospiraceae bacterium]
MPYQIDWNISLDCLTSDDLLKKIEGARNFILIDTIGTYGGNRCRIKGATTIPYPDVVDRRREFLGFQEIIVYCKEKSCVASKKVASALKMLNVPNVCVYEGGIMEWLRNGLPVEDY